MPKANLAQALATTPGELTPFEGRDVVQCRVEIPSAAGGLQEALKFDPIELRQGDTVYVLMECQVTSIRFDPIMVDKEDAGIDVRVHKLRTSAATFVDAQFAKEHIDTALDKIRLAQEAAAGIQRLPTGPDLFEDDFSDLMPDDGDE